MTSSRQLPTRHDLEAVAGNPFTFTVTTTGATITSPAVTIKDGTRTTVTADPSVPAVSQASAVTTVAFSTADTTALGASAKKNYTYSLQALVNGAGPYELVAGVLTVAPVGTAGTSSTSTAALTVTIGAAALSLALSVGSNGSGVTLLPTSNGTDDTSALNAVIGANTGVIRGVPGEEYLLSDPLVIGSNTTLDMTGCTITMKSGNVKNHIRNSAANSASRNANIRVIGGIWDRGANVEGDATGAVGSAVGSHMLFFDGVDNLEVGNLTCLSTAGKYAIAPQDVDGCWVHDIDLDVYSDGVHVNGPAYSVVVERIHGTTGDDAVAFGVREGALYQAYSYGDGPIRGFTIRDIQCTSEEAEVKLFGDDYEMSDGLVERISGSVSGAAGVWITGVEFGRDIIIRHVTMDACDTAAVQVSTSTITGRLDISHVGHRGTGAGVAVWLQANIEKVNLSNIGPAPSSYIACTDGTYGTITVEDCRMDVSSSDNIFGTFTTSVAPTIAALYVTRCYRDGVGYTGFLMNSGANAAKVVLSDCIARRTLQGIRVAAATGTTTNLVLVGCDLEGVQWAQLTGPGTIRVKASGTELANGVTTQGSPIIRPLSLDVALDVGGTGVTAGDGHLAYNTNAARGCGVGPCVSNGTLWKNLYTGSTT